MGNRNGKYSGNEAEIDSIQIKVIYPDGTHTFEDLAFFLQVKNVTVGEKKNQLLMKHQIDEVDNYVLALKNAENIIVILKDSDMIKSYISDIMSEGDGNSLELIAKT